MRRITYALGALCAVGTLTLAVPGTASASDGLMTIDEVSYANPSGCYAVAHQPFSIVNHTNEPLLVFAGPNCSGPITSLVAPGQVAAPPIGFSVFAR
jgi:hypothetical protein